MFLIHDYIDPEEQAKRDSVDQALHQRSLRKRVLSIHQSHRRLMKKARSNCLSGRSYNRRTRRSSTSTSCCLDSSISIKLQIKSSLEERESYQIQQIRRKSLSRESRALLIRQQTTRLAKIRSGELWCTSKVDLRKTSKVMQRSCPKYSLYLDRWTFGLRKSWI